jgi:hypothetical protein
MADHALFYWVAHNRVLWALCPICRRDGNGRYARCTRCIRCTYCLVEAWKQSEGIIPLVWLRICAPVGAKFADRNFERKDVWIGCGWISGQKVDFGVVGTYWYYRKYGGANFCLIFFAFFLKYLLTYPPSSCRTHRSFAAAEDFLVRSLKTE